MKLHEDWLTDGLIDFEYKKYILLAYMKEIMTNFGAKKLYPFLSELVFHYNNLLRLKEEKSLLYENFPKKVSRADFEKLKLSYDRIIKDDEMMNEIEEVIHFSLPRLKEGLDTGAALYEEIARHIEIAPIGIAPLFSREGYLLVCGHKSREAHIFRYKVTTLQSSENETFESINTEFLDVMTRDLSNTLENIKINLIRRYRFMPNPATFAAISRLSCPMIETLLPITKRKLVQYIGKAA